MTTPWPFSVWRIDIISEIVPKASNGHRYIIVAIDYFTKRVKAALYATLKAKDVVSFIQKNIIYRYEVHCKLILDHVSHFQGEVVPLLKKHGIAHHLSAPYWPQTNGGDEEANKSIKAILEKMTDTCRDWHEKLAFAL